MPSILIATDLSHRSDRALARGVRLAAALNLPLRVVSAVDDDLPASLLARRIAETESHLDRLLAGARVPADLTVTRAALPGDVASVIPAEAHGSGAACVVLGLHRPRALLDFFRETTLERLVRMIRRPVLLVRDTAERDYQRVLVPVSFSPACAAALAAARWLAPGAEVRSLHALHLPVVGLPGETAAGPMAIALTAEAEAERAAWIARFGLPDGIDAPVIKIGGFGEVLDRELGGFLPDLLALGAHTRSGLAPHALGGAAARLIRTPPCDVLVARAVPVIA